MSTAMRVVQAPIFVAPIPGYSGKLTGTIEGHEPDGRRYVSLYPYAGGVPQAPRTLIQIRATRTEQNAWEFANLEEGRTYTVIAWDRENLFDPAIKVGLIPEPM